MHTDARARKQKYISIYISLYMKTLLKTGVYIYYIFFIVCILVRFKNSCPDLYMKITNLRIVVILVICCYLPQMMSFYLSLLIMTVSYCFLHTAVSEHFLVELTIRKSIASKRKRREKTWIAKTINCCDFFLLSVRLNKMTAVQGRLLVEVL